MPLQIPNKSTSWPKTRNSFLRLSKYLMILNFKKHTWINYWKTSTNQSTLHLTLQTALYYPIPAPIPMTLQRSLTKKIQNHSHHSRITFWDKNPKIQIANPQTNPTKDCHITTSSIQNWKPVWYWVGYKRSNHWISCITTYTYKYWAYSRWFPKRNNTNIFQKIFN